MVRTFDHRWRIHTRLPERFGQLCRVTARGRLNSVRVEFEDGFWCITSRWAFRRLSKDVTDLHTDTLLGPHPITPRYTDELQPF